MAAEPVVAMTLAAIASASANAITTLKKVPLGVRVVRISAPFFGLASGCHANWFWLRGALAGGVLESHLIARSL